MSVNEHLLLIGIGPVQDFIRTARRCRDYWYGSRLLSDLAKEAARAVVRTCGDESALIFPPSIPEDPHIAVANKVLARVGDRASAETAAGAATNAVREALLARWSELVESLDGTATRALDAEMGRAQLDDLIEIQWVAVPNDDYLEARERAEALLSARKLTRTWSQPGWDRRHGIPKSSLDGAREQVIDEKTRDRWSKDAPWRLREAFDLRPQEGLAGPGLLKRRGIPIASDANLGGQDAYRHFHSTSHMAAAPLLTRIARGVEDGAVRRFQQRLSKIGLHDDHPAVRLTDAHDADGAVIRPSLTPFDGGPSVEPERVFAPRSRQRGYDGSIFFEGRLRSLLEEQPNRDLRTALEDAPSPRARSELLRRTTREAEGALADCLRALDLSRPPCPYYAFLLADGDRVGQAFTALGQWAQKQKSDPLIAHQDLAKALADYAGRARRIVIEHGGSPIYAGGDDVSALLPLHTAIPCARALRDHFVATMRAALPTDWPGAALPNMSAGLAIVHHLTTMSEARALAESAEKAAKDPARGARNALAVIADKRSGAQLEVYGHWSTTFGDGTRPDTDGLDGRLWTWCRSYRRGRLPHGAAFQLEEALRPFELASLSEATGLSEPPEGRPAAIRDLALRVLSRRRVLQSGRSDPLDEETHALLSACIGENAVRDVQRLSRELQVARLLLGALDDAWGPDAADGVKA